MSTRSTAEHWCPSCQVHLVNYNEMYVDGELLFANPWLLCVVCRDKADKGETCGAYREYDLDCQQAAGHEGNHGEPERNAA